jgi:hypothetical protein
VWRMPPTGSHVVRNNRQTAARFAHVYAVFGDPVGSLA